MKGLCHMCLKSNSDLETYRGKIFCNTCKTNGLLVTTTIIT